ncbi:MAG TPA: DNA gyrase inhibitor YacG [Bryobacteraceae bacterium]|nr:DNA gyrase inhibitor YacG [Bryobacteraceae bacterium]
MRCPICKKEVAWDGPNMPFCSDRCRLIDLGNWATEKYTIPGGRPSDLEEESDYLPDPETDPLRREDD